MQASQGWEIIELFGKTKAGKSRCWVDVAEWNRKTGSEGRVFVVSTDKATPRLLKPRPYLQDEGFVKVREVRDWEAAQQAVEEFRGMISADRHDWLVLDLASSIYRFVQDFDLARQNKGTSVRDLRQQMAEKRGQKDNRQQLEAWREIDWVNMVNPMMEGWIQDLIDNIPAHLLFVSEEKSDYDSGAPVPDGWKRLGYNCHSVLRVEWGWDEQVPLLTTWGDRERPRLQKEPMHGFVGTYLVGCAEWSL